MMLKKTLLVLAFMVLSGFLAVKVVSAQQPTPSDDQVNAIAKQLYCPVCENIPLDVCPTTACAQWRELIRQKLADGWNEQQIKDYFVQQYGARVLGTPPPKGFNWLAYVIPPLAIIAGGYVLIRAYRTWKKPVQQENPPAQPANAPVDRSGSQSEYLKELEERVRKR